MIPEFLRNRNSWNRDEIIWQVQRDSCALVQNENIAKLYIQGSEISVATAISLLEDRVNYLSTQSHSFANIQQNERYYSQQAMPPANAYVGNNYKTDIVAKGVAIINNQKQGPTLPRGAAVNSTNYDNLRDFATKLGYTIDQINIALTKCTTVVNENALLQQLMTLFPRKNPNLPVSSTSTKVTRDSAQSFDQKSDLPSGVGKATLKTDSDQKKNDTASENKLRHIVVDGSNVAMR